MNPNTHSVILEEEIDPNYAPSEEEVVEYAKWLGMDLEKDSQLLWIAREGLMAPLPKNWKPCKSIDTEDIYYFDFSTGESTWDHPCDGYYMKLYEEEKKKKLYEEEKRKKIELEAMLRYFDGELRLEIKNHLVLFPLASRNEDDTSSHANLLRVLEVSDIMRVIISYIV